MRGNLTRLLFFFLLCGSPASIFGAEGKYFQLTKLSENVYVALANESNRGVGNCSFIVTSQWICVYDSSQNVAAAEELIALIRSVSALPIRFLINSQYRGHHTHGNQSFLKAGAGIISTRQTRMDMVNKDMPQLQRYQQVLPDSIDRLKREIKTSPPGPQAEELLQELARREKILTQLSSLRLVLPEVSFESSITLHDGEQEILVLFPGKGNTAGDAVLWLADQRILLAGDLVSGSMIPDLEDSFTREWIETLLVLEKMKPEIVVPTLGSIGNESLLVETRHYLTDLRKIVKQYFDRGDTLDSVLQNCPLPAKYKSFRDTDYYPNNVEKVYQELQAEEASMAKPAPAPKKP